MLKALTCLRWRPPVSFILELWQQKCPSVFPSSFIDWCPANICTLCKCLHKYKMCVLPFIRNRHYWTMSHYIVFFWSRSYFGPFWRIIMQVWDEIARITVSIIAEYSNGLIDKWFHHIVITLPPDILFEDGICWLGFCLLRCRPGETSLRILRTWCWMDVLSRKGRNWQLEFDQN